MCPIRKDMQYLGGSIETCAINITYKVNLFSKYHSLILEIPFAHCSNIYLLI